MVRCAIYTRKSTEEGLEQEFNSLDAQRESAEAYIKSQQHEGWHCLPDRYDDGGFTGGNMERPSLKRLMADIEAGRVDCVVVYKVDRLSRSLLDFAQLMGKFDKHHIAFVSVTQQFNTTNSMVAYTGGAMRLGGWPYPVVVDFAGMRVTRKSRPILKDHDRASIVGHTDDIMACRR
jgi:site-specific DNA recombinase